MITEDALVDRVRDVCTGLDLTETVTLDFERQPVGAIDKRFTVALVGTTPHGGFGFSEEWRGTVLVSIARAVNDDYQAARRALLQDARNVRAGIVRDGAETSGEYAVEDTGSAIAIDRPPNANHLIARVSVPVNAESVL